MAQKLIGKLVRFRQAGFLSLSVLTVGLAPALSIWSGHAAANGTSYLQSGVQRVVNGGFPGAWATDSFGNTGAAGVANLQTGQHTQANMKLRAASVTKSFTGAVALQLVAEHKLSLSDTLGHWVPGILPYANHVTVKQLLNHTSGVPDYLEADSNSLIYQIARGQVSRFKTWTPNQLVAMIANQPRHQLPPNQAEYSDTNFILVGMVVEAVTHDSIQHQIQTRLITPLHLANTSFPVTDPSLTAPFAHGYSYRVEADGTIIVGMPFSQFTDDWTNYNPSFLWATGAVVSNPADLNTFMKALVGGHLLPANLTTQMKTTVPITLPEGLFPPGFGAGLGIWSWDLSQVTPVADSCNQTIYGHEGETLGYDTWAFANPSGSKAITMGVNLMFPDFVSDSNSGQGYYGAELPAYSSMWCQSY
ncbi:MAG TPA: serine hydrolase domain-containing protein [Candidatus Saccharimonadales bacterium]|nr:serine hydrolase domain-containing protein [Candidatus Saccharimonadales bacterium]